MYHMGCLQEELKHFDEKSFKCSTYFNVCYNLFKRMSYFKACSTYLIVTENINNRTPTN